MSIAKLNVFAKYSLIFPKNKTCPWHVWYNGQTGMNKKLKISALLIFLVFLPVGSMIYAVAVANYGIFEWRTIAFALLSAVAAGIVFSLMIDFLVSFPITSFKNELEKDWRENRTVKIPENTALEIKEMAQTFANILEEIEKKDAALQEANKLDELKYEFITIASHQLRTPLTEVTWSLELLESSPAVVAEPKLREVLATAKGGVKNVSNMANQLLSVLQISTSDAFKKRTAVNLDRLLAFIVAESEPAAAARKVKIQFEKSAGVIPAVSGDLELLRFVFQNLLTNAVHYGFEGKPVVVRLYSRSGSVQVEVEDEGTVIKPEEKALIFEKFFRGAEAKQIHPDGWGLALFLVKKIVDWHGGEISYDTLENGKTVFSVSLPVTAHGELQKFITSY